MRKKKENIAPFVSHRLVTVTGLFLLCVLFTRPLQAQSPGSREYKIKAAFIFNFTQFVEWPAAAFSSSNAPFVIGILGDDPFGNTIDDIISSEKVGAHQIIVQRYHDLRDMKNCHILFINGTDPEKVRENLLAINRYTLTVSDADNFMKAGGIIRLITENNKIRLQINPDAARNAELSISAKLLRVSEIFDPRSQPK